MTDSTAVIMHSWLKLNLGDAMLAGDALAELKTRLTTVYDNEGQPNSMVALYRHESSGLHCNLVVYLTAPFQQAAGLENTVICQTPALADSGFLSGNRQHLRNNY